MKIITNETVYVQREDLANLTLSNIIIPSSIFMKIFGGKIDIVDKKYKYHFVKFDSPDEIEFFKNIDWIINYNDMAKLSCEDIEILCKNIEMELCNSIEQCNSKITNKELLYKQYLTMIKLQSLKNILTFKDGLLEYDLPVNLEEINDKKQENVIETKSKRRFLNFKRK